MQLNDLFVHKKERGNFDYSGMGEMCLQVCFTKSHLLLHSCCVQVARFWSFVLFIYCLFMPVCFQVQSLCVSPWIWRLSYLPECSVVTRISLWMILFHVTYLL